MTNDDSSKPYIHSSVRNALLILKSFSAYQPTQRVSDLANSLSLPKSTVSRLLQTLASEGFVRKDPQTNAYRLGLSVLGLGGIITSNFKIYEEAAPALNKLINFTGETPHLAILDGMESVYIQKSEGNHPTYMQTYLGKRNPLYCTSSGKVLLAYSKEEIVDEVIQNGLKAKTSKTITNPDMLKAALKETREKGYAISCEELTNGVTSIAAPIRGYTGEVIATITLVGPSKRLPIEKIQRYIKLVVGAAYDISESLGYRGNK